MVVTVRPMRRDEPPACLARARAAGLEAVQLNVFAGNAVAGGLYRALGYQEAAVTMVKKV